MKISLNNMGRHLLCLILTWIAGFSSYGQHTVTGTVTDRSGPIYGATVQVKGSVSGTLSDVNGSYQLTNVKTNDTLVFSYLGYQTREVSFEGDVVINVTLLESLNELEAVVVNAGYYTVSERERTGSIASVKTAAIENQPVSNVLSAVQGRMAGVNIVQNSGVPGGGFSVQIRGINSLRRTGNYPLYIIDGVPISAESPSTLSSGILPYGEVNPLSAINPNDIESIEILKDADATAIYGSRGGNGVVLVTTKKGKRHGATEFSVNTSMGWSQLANTMELLNTSEYVSMRQEAYANDGITSYPAGAFDVNGTWDANRYTDWQKELLGETAVNSQVQFSVRGGGAQTGFVLSGSHQEQTTVFAEDFRYKTNNLSGNLSHQSVDGRLSLNASGLFSDQSNNLIRSDVTMQALRLSPNAPALYQEDGSLNWENNTFTNPVANYHSTYSNESKTFHSNISVQYELLPSLQVKVNGGLNQLSFTEMSLFPSTVYNPSYGVTPASSAAYKSQGQRFSYLVEPQLSYQKTYKEHHVEVLVGGTYQEQSQKALSVSGFGFESNALITNLASAGSLSIDNDLTTQYKYAAAFGRLNYQYKHTYLLNLTGRRDGSSRFGKDQRFSNFGAVGAAWIFSKEAFVAPWKWLSFGKLRGSYGLSGSDAIGDYQYLDTYTSSNTLYGGSTILYPSRLYNPYFSWEKTTKLEAALELGFLQDRIQFSGAWYRNRSGNQLVGIPLPATTGFSSVQSNLPATVQNIGWEFELHTTPVQTGDFQWHSDLNLTFIDNKLLEFPDLEGSTYANQYAIGYSTSIVKVYNYEGIDQDTGLYTFTDYNEDGSISSPEDNRVIRETGVKYFGGWSNQLQYKNFEFSCLFQFVKQNQRNYHALMATPGTMYNQPVEVLNVWSADHPTGTYMPYTGGANAQVNQLFGYFKSSTAAVGDASYIRLKNIQLAYRLSINHWMKDVRVYVQGQNLLTLTDYFGMDPEFVATGYLPPLKTWAVGMQFNF